jgi:hypothetical protein
MTTRESTLPYSTEDYKKYVYAQGRSYLCRIQENIEAIDKDLGLDENSEDLACMLATVKGFLWAAAFGTDERRTTAEMERDMRKAQQAPDDIDWPIVRALSTDTYFDGRTVATAVRYGERDDEYYVHVWHPDPAHPSNQPGAMIEFSQGPYPWRYRTVHVIAPGVIEVEKEEDTEAAWEGVTEDAGVSTRLS